MKRHCVRYGSVHLNERLRMNKENQKKYQAYKKAKKTYDKLITHTNALGEKLAKIQADYFAAQSKLAKQWDKKIDKVAMAHTVASKIAFERNLELKETRKSFMSKDNPDHKELFNLLLD